MTTAPAPALDTLRANPDWANLPLFDRTGWSRVRFGDVVERRFRLPLRLVVVPESLAQKSQAFPPPPPESPPRSRVPQKRGG